MKRRKLVVSANAARTSAHDETYKYLSYVAWKVTDKSPQIVFEAGCKEFKADWERELHLRLRNVSATQEDVEQRIQAWYAATFGKVGEADSAFIMPIAFRIQATDGVTTVVLIRTSANTLHCVNAELLDVFHGLYDNVKFLENRVGMLYLLKGKEPIAVIVEYEQKYTVTALDHMAALVTKQNKRRMRK